MSQDEQLKAFMDQLTRVERSAQAFGAADNDAYEEEPLLPADDDGDGDNIPPGQQSFFLGDIPPAEPASKQVAAEIVCGTMEAEDHAFALLLGQASDHAPAPLDDGFRFLNPVEDCGELLPIYRGFQKLLQDKQESVEIKLAGRTLVGKAHPQGNVKIIDEKRQLIYGAERIVSDKLNEKDILIWVSQIGGDVKGYILNGWCYLAC